MRIAFFCTRFPTVSETFVLNQLAGLLDAGFDVDIHAIRPGDDGPLQPIFRKYELDRHVSYRGRLGSVIGRAFVTLGLIARFGLQSPSRLMELRRVCERTPEITFTAALFALKGLRARPTADVVYAHFGPNGQVAAVLKAAGWLDAPVVTVFHGFDVTVLMKKWGRHYYSTLFKHGDLMLPVSREFHRRLVGFGCAESKLDVHHMGVDTRELTNRKRSRAADAPLTVLSIARLVPKKGLADGIAAVAQLATGDGPQLRYVIVGDGPLRAELEQQIRDLGCDAHIEITGWKNQDEVKAAIDEAEIYLAPSVTAEDGDEEGIPVVLMEAAATGLPLVSTRHSGIPELVRDNETGLLADEHDIDGLARALKTLAEDAELRDRLGSAGRALVEAEFDIHSLNSRLCNILEERAKA